MDCEPLTEDELRERAANRVLREAAVLQRAYAKAGREVSLSWVLDFHGKSLMHATAAESREDRRDNEILRSVERSAEWCAQPIVVQGRMPLTNPNPPVH